jgi:copper(I)-binding protein
VVRSSRGGSSPRRILIAVVAALIPLVAGCEAGVNAPTQEWHQPTDGSGLVVGDITIADAFILGAPLNASLLPGRTAGLYLGLVNIGAPDRLLSITAPGTATSVQLPGGQVSLPRQRPVLLLGPKPTVLLEHLIRQLPGGSTVTLILTFQNAGTVKLAVPVMPQAQYYSTFSPAPRATPTATVSATPSPSSTTTPSPSSSP